jgi:hypothetical protein
MTRSMRAAKAVLEILENLSLKRATAAVLAAAMEIGRAHV